MTVTYDSVGPSGTDADGWFHHVGTTMPTAARGTRKFITCAFVAGCAVAGTLPAISPADALALNIVVVQPSTLPAVPPAKPAPPLDESVVPGVLQQVRRQSGLSWGEIAVAVGVSRRTIHNWLGGGRLAGVHLTQLLEMSRVVNIVWTGSAESTRAALLRPREYGRSIVDDLALYSRPARRRPLSTVSVGDLVTPVDESAPASPERQQRPSSLRGGSVDRKRLDS